MAYRQPESPHGIRLFLARCSIAAGSAARLRRKPGFRTLRCGSGVVVIPMTLDAGKEDVGKGGASPVPLPKILESYRDKPRLGLRMGIRLWSGGNRARVRKSCCMRTKRRREKRDA